MIVTKKRRSLWQWLADKAHLQARVDKAERDRWFESGIRIAVALMTKKPAEVDFHRYGEMAALHASGAMQVIRELIAEQAHEVARHTRFDEAMAARAENLAETPPVRAIAPEPAPQPAVKPAVVSIRHIAEQKARAARPPTAQIFPPDSLSRLIDTSHVPAVARGTTGVLLGMHLGKQKAEKERQGG